MCRTLALAAALLIAGLPSMAAQKQFIEDFSTTQYRDSLNTTVWWDTVAGELKLYPFQPSTSDTYNTPGIAQAIVLDGTRAVVADGPGGLIVIDISDPDSLSVVGSYTTPGIAGDVAVSGPLAFVADGSSGLQIITLKGMTFVGSYNTPGTALGLAVSGNLCFIADNDSLQILDISSPALPARVSGYATPGAPRDVVISGNYAFVADGSAGLTIVDITDPANPAPVGGYTAGGVSVRVAIEGDHAYLAIGTAGVAIIDVSNPASPTLAGTYNTTGDTKDVFVDGDFAYLADGSAGIVILDVTDPTAPTLFDAVATPATARGIATDGIHMFTAIDVDGVAAITARSYQDPVVIGTYGGIWDLNRIEISGNYLYAAAGFDGLEIVDISDPSTPVFVGAYNTAHNAFDVTVAGDYAFVADGANGLVIIDISDPTVPTLAATHAVTGSAVSVAVDGNYAYVADWSFALRVVDISDPTAPTFADEYTFPSIPATDVAIVGDRALVGQGTEGFTILDISDPTNVSFVNTWSSGFDDATFISVYGNWAFVPTDFSGTHMIMGVDISDPDNPIHDFANDPLLAYSGTPSGVVLSGGYAFVVGDVGLEVVEVASLGTTYSTLTVGGTATGVAIAGDDVYVSGPGGTGLVVARTFNREFVLSANVGQSLPIPMDAVAVRFTPTVSGPIQWDIDNALYSWRPVNAGVWLSIPPADSAHAWRATLGAVPGGANTICSQLQIEWLLAEPTIDAIVDVPGDQGGWARIHFTRSGGDLSDAGARVNDYIIWRRVDAGAAMTAQAAVPARGELPGTVTAGRELPGASIVTTPSGQLRPGNAGDERDYVGDFPSLQLTRAGDRYLAASPAGFPPGTWEIVGSFPAFLEHDYIYTVPTQADSGSAGLAHSVHVVTAHTSSGYYVSAADSGYSVDNIAPGVPQGVAVAYNTGSGNLLSWDAATEPDFQYYRIYRGASPDFTPAPENLVHSTAAAGWTDPDYDDVTVAYKVTALDHAGNESDPGSHSPATGAGGPPVPVQNSLYQNVPNPFNPSTTIRYTLRDASDVTLTVFDAAGRRIRTLVSSTLPAGVHDVAWDGFDQRGNRVASGVYFYRLEAGAFTQTKKMVMLK